MKRACFLLTLLCTSLCAFLCVSCSGPQVVEFRLVTINTDEEPIACVALRDDEMVLDDGTNEPVKTPVQVKVSFKPRSDASGGYEAVKLGVKAVTVDTVGKITGGLKEGEPSPYVEDSRFVYWTDAKTQLFILRRNKQAGG